MRYRNEISLAKKLSKNNYADHDYYNNLISKFEKILKFYEDLKIWREFTEK
ncbi:MAG: hypothetical protein JSV23_00630 [Promethearchaeota archaeon]|nr:MAG: hypothetical protein JSV23_00630 [Candidatus Lokiarchaeota archaeon]